MRLYKHVRIASFVEMYLEWDSDNSSRFDYSTDDDDGTFELLWGALYVSINKPTRHGIISNADDATALAGDPIHRGVSQD